MRAGAALLFMCASCADDARVGSRSLSGQCSSVSTYASTVGRIVEERMEFRADGQPDLERFTWTNVGEDPQVAQIDYGYDQDGVLLSRLANTPDWPEQLDLYVYEAGQLVRSEYYFDGVLGRSLDHSYDAEQQRIETYQIGGGVSDQRITYTWQDGRLVLTETLWVDDDVVVYREERTYLEPVPSLDVDVVTLEMGQVTSTWFRYEGERLVQEGRNEGETRYSMTYSYTPQGWLAKNVTVSSAQSDFTVMSFSYDEAGHLVRREIGWDEDHDAEIDELNSVRTWEWDCR